MPLPTHIENVKKYPKMYLSKMEFNVAAGFLQGYDLATEGGLLIGFREWLILQVGYGNNLSWPELVLTLIFPEVRSP
jgi:hypothetical protein